MAWSYFRQSKVNCCQPIFNYNTSTYKFRTRKSSSNHLISETNFLYVHFNVNFCSASWFWYRRREREAFFAEDNVESESFFSIFFLSLVYLVYHFRTKLLTVTLFFAHLCARKVLAEIYFSNLWSLVTQLLQTARAAGRNIVRLISIWISWKYFVERQLDLKYDILWIHISIREKVFHWEKKNTRFIVFTIECMWIGNQVKSSHRNRGWTEVIRF